jgi:hypothetical protein
VTVAIQLLTAWTSGLSLVDASITTDAGLRKICAHPVCLSRVCAAPGSSFPGFIGFFAMARSVQWHKPQLAGSIMETVQQSIRREPKTTY